jgi:hypothetical protein
LQWGLRQKLISQLVQQNLQLSHCKIKFSKSGCIHIFISVYFAADTFKKRTTDANLWVTFLKATPEFGKMP